MPYSIELFFDPAADAFVRKTWSAVDAAGLSRSARPASARPHVTLGVWKQIDVPAAEQIVQAFAGQIAGLQLNLDRVGTFPHTTIVFFAPQITQELLDVHRRFHEQFATAGVDVWGHYRPGHWTPHCTIGERVSPQDVDEVIEIAEQAELPCVATVCELGIVQHPGAIEVVTYAAQGGQDITKATR